MSKSFGTDQRGAIHMISAFCVENSMVIELLKTAEKSNEITVIPELLKLLEIRGCLLILDAFNCKFDILSDKFQAFLQFRCPKCAPDYVKKLFRQAGFSECFISDFLDFLSIKQMKIKFFNIV
ncbi:hypothetical protein DN062_04280 [Nitrincola tibetensis]|uniref:Transposase IS4-like domain-containing protein n=1 Tax=Nitrincola tibetensis TaxID=2219697 RepID=A0A364NQX2_9GAMM|nr:hypothetical protein DN062_04280 [Nitrincola tibetensis]